MDDMPNLKKYMAKKSAMRGDDPQTDPSSPKSVRPAPQWEPAEVEGHGDVSTDDFETADTENDPLTDPEGKESKSATPYLDRYQKMKAK